MALALGMRPAKIFNGIDSAISGFLFVNGNGEVLCYQKADRQVFADFLFVNSRFEKSSTEKDKYNEGICIFLELKCFLPQITQIEIRFIAYFNLYLC